MNELTPTQYKAIQLLLEGKQKIQIAEEIGVNRNTITNWLRNDEFKEEYDRQLREIMLLLSAEAVDNIAKLMRTSNSDSVRLNAAKDILSRCGYDSKSKVEIDKAVDLIVSIGE